MSYLLHGLKETFEGETVHKTQEGEIIVYLKPERLLEVAAQLRGNAFFHFDMLMDIAGVDYLHYGLSEWETEKVTESGFSRGIKPMEGALPERRFAVVYQLLSIKHNHRLRLHVALADPLIVPSVVSIWSSANWYEREAFDLFGIWFEHHPDLRRILTDYGFVGHPFRKDFPLIGEVAMRYSANEQRVIYEPVDIEARTLVPKTIRSDNRYEEGV